MRSGVSYSVRIKASAAKNWSAYRGRRGFASSPLSDGLGEQPLVGAPLKGGLRGLRRQRVGDYRIVYELLDAELVVLVVRVAHRRVPTAERRMCAYDEDLPPFDSAQRSLRKNTMLNILTEPVIRLDLSGRCTERCEPARGFRRPGERQSSFLPRTASAPASRVARLPGSSWGRWPCTGQGGADLPDIADEWAKLIRRANPDFPEDEPWQLVVEDITKPAFMQAPASSKRRRRTSRRWPPLLTNWTSWSRPRTMT